MTYERRSYEDKVATIGDASYRKTTVARYARCQHHYVTISAKWDKCDKCKNYRYRLRETKIY